MQQLEDVGQRRQVALLRMLLPEQRQEPVDRNQEAQREKAMFTVDGNGCDETKTTNCAKEASARTEAEMTSSPVCARPRVDDGEQPGRVVESFTRQLLQLKPSRGNTAASTTLECTETSSLHSLRIKYLRPNCRCEDSVQISFTEGVIHKRLEKLQQSRPVNWALFGADFALYEANTQSIEGSTRDVNSVDLPARVSGRSFVAVT